MAWAWVQDDSQSASVGTTTIAQAYTSNVTAGNLLVCLVSGKTNIETATCADSLSQTWTKAIGPTNNPNLGSGGFSQWIFFFPNTAGGANTVTVTFSGNVTNRRITILEYSGIATTSPLDVTSGNTGSGTVPDSGAATTTANNELIFGGGLTDSGDIGTGSGFVGRQSADNFDKPEDKNGATAGSYSAFFTTTSAQWIAQMATFKEPSGGGRTTKNTRAFPLGTEIGMGWVTPTEV